MLRFISFGSGSSGNCYLLFTDTDSLLIDAGVGVRILKKHFKDLAPAMKALKEMDVPVKTIAAAAKCSLSTAYKAIKSVSEK